MKIYLASDHGGFSYKESIKGYLTNKGYDVTDKGSFDYNSEDDYPDFVIPLAESVINEHDSIGIIFGRSGNGEAIAANKVHGVRAAVCFIPEMARLARQDNYANILSIGADFVSIDQVYAIVQAFIDTPWSDHPRHKRRVEKIINYEHTNR